MPDPKLHPTLAEVLAPAEPAADQADADARAIEVASKMLQREPLEKAELDAFFDVEGAVNLSEGTNDDGPE